MAKVKIKVCPACKVPPSVEEGYHGSESCVACINSKCPVSLVDEVSVSCWNEQPDGGFEKIIDMLKDTANELCQMIDTENARLKSRICSTDLDEPSYIDHQTVYEAFKLIKDIES